MSLEEADRIMGLSSLLFRGFQDFLAAAETVDYLSVIAQVDVALQAVRKGVFILVQNLVIRAGRSGDAALRMTLPPSLRVKGWRHCI